MIIYQNLCTVDYYKARYRYFQKKKRLSRGCAVAVAYTDDLSNYAFEEVIRIELLSYDFESFEMLFLSGVRISFFKLWGDDGWGGRK